MLNQYLLMDPYCKALPKINFMARDWADTNTHEQTRVLEQTMFVFTFIVKCFQ